MPLQGKILVRIPEGLYRLQAFSCIFPDLSEMSLYSLDNRNRCAAPDNQYTRLYLFCPPNTGQTVCGFKSVVSAKLIAEMDTIKISSNSVSFFIMVSYLKSQKRKCLLPSIEGTYLKQAPRHSIAYTLARSPNETGQPPA